MSRRRIAPNLVRPRSARRDASPPRIATILILTYGVPRCYIVLALAHPPSWIRVWYFAREGVVTVRACPGRSCGCRADTPPSNRQKKQKGTASQGLAADPDASPSPSSAVEYLSLPPTLCCRNVVQHGRLSERGRDWHRGVKCGEGLGHHGVKCEQGDGTKGLWDRVLWDAKRGLVFE